MIKIHRPDGIVPSYSIPNIVKNEGDEITCTLNIPKSFEQYSDDKKHLPIWAYCEGDDTIKSGERVLTKNWMLNISADYIYTAVYDYADNNSCTSFYAGIRNIDTSLSSNIPFTGTLNFQVVDSGNIGSAGMKTPVDPGKCMPSFAYYYGCFTAFSKIPTNAGHEYAWKYSNNNGWLTVRIYDSGYLDVERTFSTENNWGVTCAHWCCTSRDISRASFTCGSNLQMPCGSCSLWDHFELADACRARAERINISE